MDSATSSPHRASASPREKSVWPVKRLGELCEVVAGQSPDGKNYNTEGKGMPFYQGKKDFGARFLGEPTTWTTQVTKIAKPLDILMSVRAPVGPVNFTREEICIGRGLAGIRCGNQLDRNFLFYQLWHLQPQIEGKEGAVFASINKSEIEALPVSLCPLDEQKRIVAVLDEALEGVAQAVAIAEKNLQNARTLFQSHLQSVFSQKGEGWVEKRLGDVADFKNGLNFTSQSKGQSLRMVGVGDFQNLAVVPIDDLKTVIIDGNLSDEYLIKRDDILTVRSNGSRDLVGRCMLVPKIDEKISFSGFIIRLRFNTREISPNFMLHFMKSSSTRERLTRDGGGANISNINQAKLSALPISYPSMNEQDLIVHDVELMSAETQRLESLYQSKLDALAELKKSLLHQAFSGNL
jgi:type I restriction enzyme S subunit